MATDVSFSGATLTVKLKDGRVISVPLSWYPRLLKATEAQRCNWEIHGPGYGIHWPEIDEDLSVEGLLRGERAPRKAMLNLQYAVRKAASRRKRRNSSTVPPKPRRSRRA